MKKFSILKGKKLGLVILVALSLLGLDLMAQSIHIAAGTTMSQYDFTSADGDHFDQMKAGSGTYYRMGAEFKILDTLSLISSTSPKAFYYANHKSLANFLSRLNLETSIESNQLNAVGDVLGVAFNYQTNFIGLNLGLGYQQSIFKGWSLKAIGKVQGMKIVQGNQELQGVYKDLTKDPDFNKLQLALGWEFSLSKQVNPGLVSFISFSKSNTMNVVSSGNSTLNFHNTMFSIGLKFSTNKN
jgi:hypothetical protein